ncbi:unnamed protein product [Cuscuta campestris]|uniref:Uncharacterized protein n=1 Tax=Cuscuta campestris TaxID=132261 RepID=A0A484L278_9ASTE|nr:unnamed protein product [Cuscuta campestris]
MENTGASSGFQYKRRRILTQTQREEMENENQISAEVTPSVEGQSFLDASEIEILFLESCLGTGANITTRSPQTSPARPRICLWGEIPIKKKITHTEMDAYVGDVQSLKTILVPDKFEATAEWYLNFHPLETTKHPELDAFVAKLECRGEVHIPVERKRKARNVPSPTRDNSEERNEHISSPQESQRS